MAMGLYPVRDKKFFSSPKFLERPWGQPAFTSNWCWDSFLVEKLPRCDDDNSSPQSAEGKRERSYTSISPKCCHDVNLDNLY
jgi:hypothetical protein